MGKTGTPVGNYVPDFELPGIDDQVHHLSRYLEQWRAVGVVFICNQSSYVDFYLDRLKQIQSQFEQQGFILVGINAKDANQYPECSFEYMKQFARDRKLNFPYLWDSTQDVAQGFGVEKMPTAFLIDKEGILRYTGSVDDSPQEPEAVRVPYFKNAIAALLSGEDISPKSTEVTGSQLEWRK
ncbi:MAG: thioredoxin family protein [Symploca sp. SIO3E6]|nr:thioredoxin family protein [Caldora sp. SIO3E6]